LDVEANHVSFSGSGADWVVVSRCRVEDNPATGRALIGRLMFLRMAIKDTFVLSADVTRVLPE